MLDVAIAFIIFEEERKKHNLALRLLLVQADLIAVCS